MDLLIPEIGLVVFQTIAFLLLMFLLGKFAWKQVLAAIKERENSIDDALNKAELAKLALIEMASQNEDLMKQARAERDELLKVAKLLKDNIVNEAKTQAQAEGVKLIEKARIEIENQKKVAVAELKSQVSALSLEIAERVLRSQLDDKAKQQDLVASLLKDVELN